ncbi:MAG: multiheme c-type cytochrome [Bryobacteraceae bacterium]
MTNTLQRAYDSPLLRHNGVLTFSEGKYRTVIEGSALTVSDGINAMRLPIQWAFGLGRAGQTYVFEHGGQMYESRVSYYNSLKALDLTLGANQSKPATLIEAAGRPMNKTDVRECFGCHSTGGVKRDGMLWESLIPGVSCENCHGSAEKHVQTKAAMLKLSSLSAEDTNELCGACHRTWGQVIQMNLRGSLNVRFQPYRITNSKCFDAEDRRIACTACHNPHSELIQAPAAYDSKCLACHSGARRVRHAAKQECVTCHMPKVRLPGSHFDFADHQIRIARQGDPYPN